MENEKFFEIKDLVVKFGPPKRRNAVLKGINLSVPKGKVLGLVGESGCGKSVTMLSAMGLLPKRNCEISGSIRFDGTPEEVFEQNDNPHLRRFLTGMED